jgi:excisionase family DNA binding protein
MPKTESTPDADLLTTDQVIDRLLEDANLRRIAATCVLPAVRWGNDWRFRRTDLEEWIRRQGFSPADGSPSSRRTDLPPVN